MVPVTLFSFHAFCTHCIWYQNCPKTWRQKRGDSCLPPPPFSLTPREESMWWVLVPLLRFTFDCWLGLGAFAVISFLACGVWGIATLRRVSTTLRHKCTEFIEF